MPDRTPGLLDCTEVKLRNDSGPALPCSALDANTLQVGQNMRLSGEFTGNAMLA
jgi:hypothetical protein